MLQCTCGFILQESAFKRPDFLQLIAYEEDGLEAYAICPNCESLLESEFPPHYAPDGTVAAPVIATPAPTPALVADKPSPRIKLERGVDGFGKVVIEKTLTMEDLI